MVDVEHSAEIMQRHFVDGVSIRISIAAPYCTAKRSAARGTDRLPVYRRAKAALQPHPFKEEIERRLRQDHRIPNTRICEFIAVLGYEGGKTILDQHLREVRPHFAPRRTYQRTVYRPGEICQFDLWEPDWCGLSHAGRLIAKRQSAQRQFWVVPPSA